MDENARESAPLSSLLSDPKLLSTLTGLLGTAPVGTRERDTQQPPSLPEGLGSVLSNPELMAKLPSVMAMLRPMIETTGTRNAAEETAPKESPAEEASEGGAVPAVAPSHGHAPRERCRKDLLLALKPFLSKERCEAVDMILRLSALGTVLKQLQ